MVLPNITKWPVAPPWTDAIKKEPLEARPRTGEVDYTAISQMVIEKFPKVMAELAKLENDMQTVVPLSDTAIAKLINILGGNAKKPSKKLIAMMTKKPVDAQE